MRAGGRDGAGHEAHPRADETADAGRPVGEGRPPRRRPSHQHLRNLAQYRTVTPALARQKLRREAPVRARGPSGALTALKCRTSKRRPVRSVTKPMAPTPMCTAGRFSSTGKRSAACLLRACGHRHHHSRDLGPPPHVHPRRPLGLARHRARLPRPPAGRLRDELETQGHPVNRKRVQRLMRQMGLSALYPKPRTSQPDIDPIRQPTVLFRVDSENARLSGTTPVNPA